MSRRKDLDKILKKLCEHGGMLSMNTLEKDTGLDFQTLMDEMKYLESLSYSYLNPLSSPPQGRITNYGREFIKGGGFQRQYWLKVIKIVGSVIIFTVTVATFLMACGIFNKN